MSIDWPTTTVGDLFEIGPGKSVTPAARNGNRQYPFLRTANVFWGRISLTEVDKMHFSDEEIASKSLKIGDLLVCEGGDIGRAAVWDGRIANIGFQNHLHRLRPKSGDVLPQFFMYYLQAGFTQLGLYEGAGNRTTIPNLSRSGLAALEVPRPPRKEQEEIVVILSTLQRAIEVEEKLSATLRELKEAAMRQLFTRGLRGGTQRESEIGSIPNTWDVVPLGRYLRQAQYGLSMRGHSAGRTPILRMNCQLDGQTTFRDLQFVDLDSKMLDAFRLNDGDLLFNRTNSFELVGRTAIFRSNREAVFASYLIRLDVDREQFQPEFLNYYFNQPIVQEELKKLASRGVGQANISAGKLKEFFVPKADLAEQREISAVLQAVDSKIDVHKRKHELLKSLFSNLLSELMAARIRLDGMPIAVQQAPIVRSE